jgi:hypothetical protein
MICTFIFKMLPMKELVTEKSLLPYFYLFLEKTSQQEDSNGRFTD